MGSKAWFRFFSSDWLARTAGLSAAERGVYITLLAMIYDKDGPIKRDDSVLARRCGLPIMPLRRALSALMALEKITQNDALMLDSYRAQKERSYREKMIVAKRLGASITNQKKIDKSKGEITLSEFFAHAQRTQSGTLSARILDLEEESSLRSDSKDNPNGLSSMNGHKIAKPKKEISTQRGELVVAVASAWNNLAASCGLRQIQSTTPRREAAIMARARDLVEVYDFPDALTGFQALFGHIRGSPFLRGETGKYRVTFDFAITQSSFTKIMERTYEENR